MSIRVLLVDDQGAHAGGVSHHPRGTEDIGVVGEAQDGTEAVRLAS